MDMQYTASQLSGGIAELEPAIEDILTLNAYMLDAFKRIDAGIGVDRKGTPTYQAIQAKIIARAAIIKSKE